MATADDPRVTRLQAQNTALAEELAQCQSDKEFVWSLWKKLQVANPDVTQAISLVVQREKEKAELKDRKILKILGVKDDRIAELEQLLSQQQDEFKVFISRKLRIDDENTALQTENQSLQQQKQQLQEQVTDMESRLESSQEVNNKVLRNLEKQKKDAKQSTSKLTEELESLQEDLKKSEETCDTQKAKIKSLEKKLRQTRSSSQQAEKQLTEDEDRLNQAEDNLQQTKAELNARQNELTSTRKELSELQKNHGQALEQATGQADIIRQLQTLQIDTQKVLKNQEDAHKHEVSSFHTMYAELQSRNNAIKQSEQQLKHQLSTIQKELAKAKKQLDYRPDTRNVGIQVDLIPTKDSVIVERDQEVLDMAWDLQSRGRRAASTPVKNSSNRRTRSLSPTMMSHRQATYTSPHIRDDLFDRPSDNRNDRLHTPSDSRNDLLHRTSESRNGLLHRPLDSRNDLLHRPFSRNDLLHKPYKRDDLIHKPYNRDDLLHRRLGNRPLYSRDDMFMYEVETENILSGSPPDGSPPDEDQLNQEPRNRKLTDLRKLLKLKNKELEEMRKAHNRRHERVKVLQASHSLLREQIKTYEAYESATGKQKKKKPKRSADPKSLQREHSEVVWNELTYYKKQVADALQERMNLEEELDCLKVQTSCDATTIEELNRGLQHARQDLQEHLTQFRKVNKRAEREREIVEELKQKNRALNCDKEELQDQRKDITIERTELEKEIRVVKKELSQLRAEYAQKDSTVYSMKKDISRLRSRLRHRHRHTVGGVTFQKSPQQYQSLLNKSIQEMSRLFPEFDQEGWEETSDSSSSDDAEETVESSGSLGQKIVASSSNTNTAKKNINISRRARRRHDLGRSPRQLIAVQKHLLRMARAYEDQQPAGKETLVVCVGTQTDRVSIIRVKDAGVGDSSIDGDGESTQSGSTETPRRHSQRTVEKKTIATSPHLTLSKLSHAISRKQHAGSHSVSSLKQRVASLQHQVAALKETKTSLQKTATEQCELADRLQEDFNLANQKLKLSKQTVQRLQSELQLAQQEKRSLEIHLEAKKTESDAIRHSETAWKQMETRIKTQSAEVSRQTAAMKALKAENETHIQTSKSIQDKMNRMEKDVSQKRSLIEDLKVKAKAAEMRTKSEANNKEEVEEKLKSITEQLERRKAEIESLRKQLRVVSKEKRQYEQQWLQTQAELDKKCHLVHEANLRCNEAESTAAEIESAATQQLRALAMQTEGALQAANEKLKKSRKQADELETFVRNLGAELIRQVQELRLMLRQILRVAQSQKKDDPTGSMSSRAQSIASDILNLSSSDLEGFFTDETDEEEIKMEQEEKAYEKQDRKWRKRLEACLEVPASHHLLTLILSKITEKDNILKQLR